MKLIHKSLILLLFSIHKRLSIALRYSFMLVLNLLLFRCLQLCFGGVKSSQLLDGRWSWRFFLFSLGVLLTLFFSVSFRWLEFCGPTSLWVGQSCFGCFSSCLGLRGEAFYKIVDLFFVLLADVRQFSSILLGCFFELLCHILKRFL